jgi:hypothetical protein
VALHCCFVCAFGISTDKSVKQAAKAIDESCFRICVPQRLLRCCNRLTNLSRTPHCSEDKPEGILQARVALRQSDSIADEASAAGQRRWKNQVILRGISPFFRRYRINFCFNVGAEDMAFLAYLGGSKPDAETGAGTTAGSQGDD